VRRGNARIAVALGALLLASCGGSDGSSSTTAAPSARASEPTAGPSHPSSSPTTAPATAEPASGPCANDYQPVARGDTWTYDVSGSGGTGYTDTITNAAASGFTITSDFGRVRRQTQWSCRPEGLVALRFGGGAAGTLTSEGLWALLRTTGVTGITIPRSIGLGDTWHQTFELKGTIEIGGARTTASGSVDERFEAGGVDSVTVPAGAFDAVAIDTMLTFDIQTMVAGVRTPVKVVSTGTTYLARGIGLVKATSETSLFGQLLSATVELTGYSVS
jgi:hypothetical protein